MDVIRIREPNAIAPLHVVLICLIAATVGGGCLLLSAAESKTLVDGAIAWQEESPLRAVVQLLCLNYQLPTVNPGEFKVYLLGIGAGLAALSLGIAILVRTRIGDEEVPAQAPAALPTGEDGTAPVQKTARRHIGPLAAAQALMALYLLWSFASGRWSAAPELAVGGAILLSVHLLWSFSIGLGLHPLAARLASRSIVVVAGVTAIIALWYFHGRNPTLRAKFPFGNPTFLAAALIPGILLACTLATEKIVGALGRGGSRPIVALGAIITAGLGLYVLAKSGSRGPLLGLWFGILAIAFFASRRWWKTIPLAVVIATLAVGLGYFLEAKDQPSPTGRGATLRVRLYAWEYAWRMFEEKPLTGHGQGGYVLTADSFAADDVLHDPLPLRSRIAHAHNEWLETLADLGAVGLVLVLAALILTMRAGMRTLSAARSRIDYWTMLGLLGGLVGLIVEEATGVGLRVSGVGTMFYTVLGLIWAMSGDERTSALARLTAVPWRRKAGGTTALLLGCAALVVTQQDFNAARADYEVEQALSAKDYDTAVRLAEASRSRLNPQRALTNLSRQAEAQIRIARDLLIRGIDRQERAAAEALPNRQLFALAQDDLGRSLAHCYNASEVLRELVRRSPGYLNHGRLEYRLNLTAAQNPGVADTRDRYIGAAAAAVDRELRRQPYNQAVALELVRVLPSDSNLAPLIEVLARPLRYGRLSKDYVELLSRIASGGAFESDFAPIVRSALETANTPGSDTDETPWAPETLRLAATIRFMDGNYERARLLLEAAAVAYERLGATVPMGSASCYAELADCKFFDDPEAPQAALSAANRSIELAPSSLEGRHLKQTVRRRLVDYYIAAGNEDEAVRMLWETAPANVPQDAIPRELGARYRRLCDSLLQRREAQILRKPVQELLPKLKAWITRALELNPDDAASHYVAADLTFQEGDDAAVVSHLREALRLGAEPEAVARFVALALDQRPDSQPLRVLQLEFTPDRGVVGPVQPGRND